jgi:S1-C subfamily serine protease
MTRPRRFSILAIGVCGLLVTAALGTAIGLATTKGAPPRDRARPPLAETAGDLQARSVVRISTSYRSSDYYQPWQMSAEGNLQGSGCVIEGNRILTGAHVVADSMFVQVRKSGDPGKYAADVEFVGHDTELAVLRVRDASFFRDAPPLPIGELPRRRDKVEVYGYPEGGDELSVTEGVVSRIEVTEYAHSGRSLLTFQTDAAINPGSSGGPVIKDGRIAGVSFQKRTDAENVGYAVPAPLIARFLEDIRDGSYDGVPELGIEWDAIENRAKREYLGVRPGLTGVRVFRVLYGSSAWGLLKEGDVLLSLDGVPIADDGSTTARRGERVLFTHLLTRLQLGQAAHLGVLRDGQEISVAVPMKPPRSLVPGPFYGVRPRFYVFAGLVFTPLTRNYLENWTDEADIPVDLEAIFELGRPSPERQEVVIISHVLPDAVNEGYHESGNLVVATVNRMKIGKLADVVEALRHPQGRFHIIETESGLLIVLDAAEVERSQAAIIARYGLPGDRSPDLR